ncbi:MAG: LytTR family DNA-binding domain-containing protein [Gemmatimonadaceae bacterium]|jgi:DNA-binding LytR/AlgR family response regulator|nr:LytTR family DNA-binding domain-containing protein [Gemmatimonadaceae bacterium]
MTLRVVVADDEPLAAEGLAVELRRLGCDVVAVTRTGDDAIAACLRERPALCVCDVAMPGRDGLAVARALRVAAPGIRVIFVTAHPHYAVEAFAADVVDFVPKPVRRSRLAEALARASRSVAAGADEARLVVGERGALHMLSVRDIEWVQADGAVLWLHTAARAWLLRERMHRIEERLAGHGFVRVHRSALVREASIVSLAPGEGGESVVVLLSGARVRVARDRVADVRARLLAVAGMAAPGEG